VDGVESVFRKGIAIHDKSCIVRTNCPFYPVGIPVFGPTALAARMEGSKAFSKAFMSRHSIPTAEFRTFSSNEFQKAMEYVKTCGHKVVLKASGLAAGKGVLLPNSVDEAVEGLNDIMVRNVFGDAGTRISKIPLTASAMTFKVISRLRSSHRGMPGRARALRLGLFRWVHDCPVTRRARP
jgi:hypothetical protein